MVKGEFMNVSFWRVVAVTMLPAALAGCSTATSIVNEWSNPAYHASSFRRIMIGGIDEPTSVRRNLEDEFVTQLRNGGIEALASYRFVTDELKLDEAKLKQAARKAGADGVIVVRSVSVEQKTEREPEYFPFPVFGIFGRNFGATWSGPRGGSSASRSVETTSETTLHDAIRDRVAWSGTLKTSEPADMNATIKEYVQTVVEALKAKNLLAEGIPR